MKGRTDMAFEAHSRLQSEGKVCEGVRAKEWEEEGVCLCEVTVLTAEGEKAIGKPRGKYLTLELPANWQVDSSAAAAAPRLLAWELSELLPREGTVLVAGLGNMRITPDSIGPLTVDFTARRVILDGETLDLSPKEYDLLFFMVRNRGIALTREKLISEV